jgi:hypothetical protein
MRSARIVLMVLAIAAMAVAVGDAQSRGMGRVTGTVVDEAGAPVADVEVKTATAAGTVIECKSDATGKWTLSGIGRGEWHVSFTKTGFATKRIKAIVEREIERSEPIKITLAKGG